MPETMPELADLELLVNTTDDMLAVLDRNLRFRVVNDAYSYVFGLPRTHFPGRSMAELFSHDPAHYTQILEPILRRCLADEEVHFEQWVPIPGFGDQYLDLRYFPLRDAQGAIEGIVVRGRNRTDIMRSMETIRRSEALLKRTERIARLGGWTFDVATQAFQWTDEMYAIHEVGRDFDVTPENIKACIPQSYLADLLEKFAHTLSGEPTEGVFELLTPSGKIKWVRVLSFPHAENGRVTRVEGILQDITELRDAQSGLGKAMQALDNHKKVLDQHALLATTDRHGLLTFVNDKFLEISGYRRNELIGQPLDVLMTALAPRPAHDEVWKLLRAGRAWQGESCNRDKNGLPYWLHSTIVPFHDEDEVIEEVIVVSTDINELKRTEETLRRAQKMDAIGQLSGGIAHDFNNLLSIVVGNIELLEEELARNPEALVRLGNARNAALRGSTLTRRLLNFSAQAPIPGKALDPNAVLRGMEVLISRSLTARVTVDMRLGEVGLVEVSERDFEDAMINLALNASDAMPDGGRLTFTTRSLVLQQPKYFDATLVPMGAYVEVTVADTGRGIAPELLGKIFEPYFTTKASDKGSGLGLAMVYGFVQRSQGWILVESTPGFGTSFRLILPQSGQKVAAPAPVTARNEQGVASAGRETILLVDDEVEILNLNNTILASKGYHVLCSQSGDEALRVIENGAQVDLLFTDVVMPGRLNGFELAEEALKLRPGLKVLFSTGYAKVLGDETKQRWGRNILQKPFRSLELTRKVRELLDAGT